MCNTLASITLLLTLVVWEATSYPQTRRNVQFVNEGSTGYHSHSHHDSHHTHNHDGDSSESYTHVHREVIDGNHDHQTHRHNVAFVDDDNSRDKIIFPDDNINRYTEPPNSGPVPVCTNSTFCEDAPFYPEDAIRVALSERTNVRNVLTVDRIDVVQRIDSSDIELCPSNEKVVFPKTAENERSEWLFILNQSNITQGVRTETCSTPGKECEVIGGYAEGYTTYCKQKYIYRELMAYVNGSIVTEKFRFPSSCCCYAKYSGDILTRMGMSQEKSRTGQQSPADPKGTKRP